MERILAQPARPQPVDEDSETRFRADGRTRVRCRRPEWASPNLRFLGYPDATLRPCEMVSCITKSVLRWYTSFGLDSDTPADLRVPLLTVVLLTMWTTCMVGSSSVDRSIVAARRGRAHHLPQEVETLDTSKSAAQVRPSAVSRETSDGERRVALVPRLWRHWPPRESTSSSRPGAGLGALIPDELYKEAGANIVTRGPPTSSSRSHRRRRRGRQAPLRADADRLPRPAQRREPDRCAVRGRCERVRRRGDPAHPARQVMDGCRRRRTSPATRPSSSRRSESTRFFPMLTTRPAP